MWRYRLSRIPLSRCVNPTHALLSYLKEQDEKVNTNAIHVVSTKEADYQDTAHHNGSAQKPLSDLFLFE